MARTKEFDKEAAVDAAIGVFREHGFEGTSTAMLVDAMKIGRQSLYDTFGDKWQLYRSAVEHYAASETNAHLAALRSREDAMDGIRAMLDRVVETAEQSCLGIGSICEFGQSRPELSALQQVADRRLKQAAISRIAEAQAAGDIDHSLSVADAADFLFANVAAIRIAGRGGADRPHLKSLGMMALRALT
ncbi:TetR/AcrR family transcriptional regulator [Pararhizobium sp. DWP1-1-3]|uniref:TetR/AcrR family transcriptional regulator n=1 Tax=Pararhizobium sp. DWP1-1-3 TaxID=2804652 RepID=UPI003CE71FF9